MRGHLIRAGYNPLQFVIINKWKERGCGNVGFEDEEDLAAAVGEMLILQDDDENKLFEVLGGSTGDFMLIDRCGRLSYQLKMPFSSIQYPYVKAAILSTIHDQPCGPCGIEYDATIEEPNTVTVSTEPSNEPTEVTPESEDQNLHTEATEETRSSIESEDVGNKTTSEAETEANKQEFSNSSEIPDAEISTGPTAEDAESSTTDEVDDEEVVMMLTTVERILTNFENVTERAEATTEEQEVEETVTTVTESSSIEHGKLSLKDLINSKENMDDLYQPEGNNDLEEEEGSKEMVNQEVSSIDKTNVTSTSIRSKEEEDETDKEEMKIHVFNKKHKGHKSMDQNLEKKTEKEVYKTRIFKNKHKVKVNKHILSHNTTSSGEETGKDNKSIQKNLEDDEEVYKTRFFKNKHEEKVDVVTEKIIEEDDDAVEDKQERLENEEDTEKVHKTHVFMKKHKHNKLNVKVKSDDASSSTEIKKQDEDEEEVYQTHVYKKQYKEEEDKNLSSESDSLTTVSAEEQVKSNIIKKTKSNDNSAENGMVLPLRIILHSPHIHRYGYKIRKHEYLVLKTGDPSYHGHLEKESKDDLVVETKHHKSRSHAKEEFVDKDGVKYTKIIGNKYKDIHGNVVESIEETFSVKEYELSQEDDENKKNNGKIIKGKEQLEHHYEKLIPWVRHIMEIQDTDPINLSPLSQHVHKLKRRSRDM